ncbi:DUF5723 family protein [Chitinophaga nivalis]|uniref:DUF5723 family protein n=1 Tax=Chitinophaga nivalis TaxID=2991709 RepID=A0ABT3IHP6_9BACT|nr:DUF5723 family protein [Chitinophaga nivalis]MCW3466841.1 DUF5723 family protein [Chitinophaga nivalis]MCW3483468.1 DUF5723 family protein [Chitinophaga nivalis]
MSNVINRVLSGTVVSLLLVNTATAQTFPGYHNSTYAGIHGVIANPASAAGSRYKWDVNIIGADVKAGNTYVRFPKSLLFNQPDNFRRNRDYFLDSTAQRRQSGWGAAEIVMPSVLYAIDEKQSISFIWRVRSSANGGKLTTPIANFFGIDFPNPQYAHRDFYLPHTAVSANIWNEMGISYARVIKEGYNSRWKAGITVKLLGGIAGGYAAADNVSFELNNRQQADITSGVLHYGYSDELDHWQSPTLRNFQPFQNIGVGVDLGVIYEYRPDNGGFGKYEGTDADEYKFRIGVSITDIGRIKYQKAANNTDLNLRKDNVNPNALTYRNNEGLRQYAARLNRYFTPIASPRDFNMTLPTALNLMGDYNIDSRFFVSANAVIALHAGKKDVTKTTALTQFMVTPRYETARFGAYLPVVVNYAGQLDAGVGIRFGPVVLGSYSILSNLVQSRVNHADAFVALRINSEMFNRSRQKDQVGCPVNNY